ncbi:clan AA aspartic protease [Mucilaginibacter hurinus]|uniref:Clan AA aspartic protease n=1 Tax=Mucilaginibacter hurinus TaxID=2201324 RepID=A0A367GV69_9SPHI|nr:retropepsin-like aspartic protease [Mucilaginibacter hurinus]RCH56563.1 clan AA aspartic protease [Mucilaginibacter hurinus]
MTKHTIPLQILDLHDDGFHPIIDVTLYGNSFKLVLDTGASKTAFDKTLLAEANADALISATDKLSTGLGTNSMESYTAIITDLYIGDLKIDEFEVAVLDLSTINIAYEQMAHPQVLGVLGGDILMKYQAIIDYGKKRLVLKVS